ncbi:anaphase-promoting complex subunit 10 isoform X2 [Artibeus jamaicensis]|uniref:anaphase-promoting complex subunit 10 isoform X2 n=1 Tax=Artibeus jamaicensis TaxID=9417 RepID=UPI00187BEC15|nr:anaphase-promoting complex subunit 10 isoform X2 [Artibeus jamaicensis]
MMCPGGLQCTTARRRLLLDSTATLNQAGSFLGLGKNSVRSRRKTTVKTLCIYADYKSDESYTPSKISVRVGNNFHNLQEIRQLELVEPSGWIHVPLTDNHKKPTRTFMIQIAVLANHQNGRDTHMRQIKIYTPVEESSIGKFPRCTTIDFMMYRSIR